MLDEVNISGKKIISSCVGTKDGIIEGFHEASDSDTDSEKSHSQCCGIAKIFFISPNHSNDNVIVYHQIIQFIH